MFSRQWANIGYIEHSKCSDNGYELGFENYLIMLFLSLTRQLLIMCEIIQHVTVIRWVRWVRLVIKHQVSASAKKE